MGDAPVRLLDSSEPERAMLAAYAKSTEVTLSETRGWLRLEHHQRARRSRSSRLVFAVAAVAFALPAAIVVLRWQPKDETISAEKVGARKPRAAASQEPRAVVKAEPPQEVPRSRQRAAAKPGPASLPSSKSRALEAAAPAPESVEVPSPALSPSSAAAPSVETPERPNTEVCVQEQRSGRYQQALDCYDRIGRGSGVSAELALYEKARLENNVFGRYDAALSTLDAHRARFDGGALSVEVKMLRIETLVQSGRHAEALTEIERALSGAAGREHRGELLFLRGKVLRARGDCPGALKAYDEAEAAGLSGARLARAREACAGKP
jgi:hypothetical protein